MEHGSRQGVVPLRTAAPRRTVVPRHGVPRAFYSRGRNIAHFLAGLLFTVIYWPLGACAVICVSLYSSMAGHSPEAHRALGQRTVSWLLARFVGGLLLLGIMRVDDTELREVVPLAGPLIIVSNHPAMWDSLLIMRHCNQVSCIMKASLLSNPILRGGSLFAGFLPNTPRLSMIRKATERLRGGGQLLLFPEGTRTRAANKPLNPFNHGMALIADKSRAPLLPVFISTNSPYLRKGWPIWKMPRLPISISVRVGDVQRIRPGEKTRDFSDRVEAVFRRELSRHG